MTAACLEEQLVRTGEIDWLSVSDLISLTIEAKRLNALAHVRLSDEECEEVVRKVWGAYEDRWRTVREVKGFPGALEGEILMGPEIIAVFRHLPHLQREKVLDAVQNIFWEHPHGHVFSASATLGGTFEDGKRVHSRKTVRLAIQGLESIGALVHVKTVKRTRFYRLGDIHLTPAKRNVFGGFDFSDGILN